MEITENEKEFLIGLAELTRKTGIVIGGCGCCGSPFLNKVEITGDQCGYAYMDYVEWIDPSDPYDWKNKSCNIVRKGS